jgi:chemotaxis protein methyltransferase WspC
MRALGLNTPEAYAVRLAGDMEEFQLLLTDVAVPETWFFRGGDVFTYLGQHVADVLQQRGWEKSYRILSVPCSTGEEPYSLAIALLEAGVTPASCQIEAVDVCSGHLEKARRARFGSFSFRQIPPMVQERYFQPVEGGWELDSGIRSRVRFRQGNLLDPLFLAGEESFDLILCRNLFIYLTPEARRQALNTIERLLAAEGWLCTGHADPLDLPDPAFTRIGPEGYFLYRRAEGKVVRWCGGEVLKDKQLRNATSRQHATTPPPHHRVAAPATMESSRPVDLLEQARRQADNGQLVDALASCQEALTQLGPSADLYSLMGVIHQARQENDEAVRCYRRALYLEREHPEALRHLMVLSQGRGDGAQAERLRRRLERATPGGEA